MSHLPLLLSVAFDTLSVRSRIACFGGEVVMPCLRPVWQRGPREDSLQEADSKYLPFTFLPVMTRLQHAPTAAGSVSTICRPRPLLCLPIVLGRSTGRLKGGAGGGISVRRL